MGTKPLPPPITVVAIAAKNKCLLCSVLQRSYEEDGRLVLRKVELKPQTYLKVSRRQGRLILTVARVGPPAEIPS